MAAGDITIGDVVVAEPARAPSQGGVAPLPGRRIDEATRKKLFLEVKELGAEDRELFETYCGLSADEALAHILAIRERAFDIWPYACISGMRFYSYALLKMPYYAEVVERLRGGATFCDAGCCFGQALRHLAVRDKVPQNQLFGFDLERGFIDMGYELFRDKDTFGATFTTGNVTASPEQERESGCGLPAFNGRMDVVFCGSFLHVFDWDDMIAGAKRLVALTTPKPGSVICGKQIGSTKSGSYQWPSTKGTNWRHDPESMARFWKQVGDETGTSWEVKSGLYEGLWELFGNTKRVWSEPNQRMIWWKATRL